MENKGFFQDDNGNNSTGRIAVWFLLINGTLTNALGLVGYIMKNPDAWAVISAGCALLAAAAGVKGLMKKFEGGKK